MKSRRWTTVWLLVGAVALSTLALPRAARAAREEGAQRLEEANRRWSGARCRTRQAITLTKKRSKEGWTKSEWLFWDPSGGNHRAQVLFADGDAVRRALGYDVLPPGTELVAVGWSLETPGDDLALELELVRPPVRVKVYYGDDWAMRVSLSHLPQFEQWARFDLFELLAVPSEQMLAGGAGAPAAPPETSPAPGAAAGSASAWRAGALTAETLEPPLAAPQAEATGLEGPEGAGLEPLIATVRAAADGCSYPAALAGAEHLARFDPEHPFLRANRARLGELAERQRAAEALIWQASAELSAGRLKRARELAAAATDRALSCQTEAVAGLVRGIDTALDQQRRAQSAANRQAAAALLPGLVDLARLLAGGAAGATVPPPVASPAAPAATVVDLGDPCAFRYEYRNVWNVEPVCTCLGYRFDASRHRCVPAAHHP